ncbi:MmyB family transcriptional regulator [Streptomyces sp. B21-108]|uniref:MmyB family transcriptional regulator n=1 Tax=Streptomyces sp. B21-108 TaxID=3039419 RepID=UPI002FF0B7D4
MKLLLEALRPNPAYVVNRTMDVLACNPSCLRLFAGLDEWPAKKRNFVRYLFLHPQAPKLFDRWDEQILVCPGRLRALAGTAPKTPDLVPLVDELLLNSREFTRLWERYDVKPHAHGRKTFHHPDVGDLTLGYQSLPLEGTPGHRLVAYYAGPQTSERDAMVLLDRPTDPHNSQSPAGHHR